MVLPRIIHQKDRDKTFLKPGETTLSWWYSLLQSRDKTMSSNTLSHFWNLLKPLWIREDLCLNCLLRMVFPRTTTNQQRQNNVLLLQEIRIAKWQFLYGTICSNKILPQEICVNFERTNSPSTDGLPSALVHQPADTKLMSSSYSSDPSDRWDLCLNCLLGRVCIKTWFVTKLCFAIVRNSWTLLKLDWFYFYF